MTWVLKIVVELEGAAESYFFFRLCLSVLARRGGKVARSMASTNSIFSPLFPLWLFFCGGHSQWGKSAFTVVLNTLSVNGRNARGLDARGAEKVSEGKIDCGVDTGFPRGTVELACQRHMFTMHGIPPNRERFAKF